MRGGGGSENGRNGGGETRRPGGRPGGGRREGGVPRSAFKVGIKNVVYEITPADLAALSSSLTNPSISPTVLSAWMMTRSLSPPRGTVG